MTNNEELHKIMTREGMGRRDVARLLGLKIHENGQCYALCNWLARPKSKAYRVMMDVYIILLRMQVAALTPADRAKFEGETDKSAVIAKNRLKRECEADGYQYADGSVKRVKVRKGERVVSRV